MDKQLCRFLNRKPVKEILGKDYMLSNLQKIRMLKLLEIYQTPKNMENMLVTIANFIKYDVSNYAGRYRRLLGTNGTSAYTQMLRYGRAYKSVYSLQSEKKIKHFKNRTQYWLDIGYSKEHADNEVKKIQTERGQKAALILTGTSRYTCRSIEFWLTNGFSEEEAIEKVRKIQTTNGLMYYEEKYPNNYKEMFSARITKWLESYNKNDMDLINLKKSHSIEGGIARGLSFTEAMESYNKNVKHMKEIRRLPSKISQKMCEMLFDRLGGTCYFSDLNYEYLLNGYRVDFYHKDTGTVVEFYGDYYHQNPSIFPDSSKVHGVLAEDRWAYDSERKNKILKNEHVNNFFEVWESDFRSNPSEIVNKIIQEIQND